MCTTVAKKTSGDSTLFGIFRCIIGTNQKDHNTVSAQEKNRKETRTTTNEKMGKIMSGTHNSTDNQEQNVQIKCL